ncbi:MAG: heme exporter protein CcmD [Nocardioides sp.]
MSEFLAMSGYGKYLWPSFGLVIGVIVLNVVLAVTALKRAQVQAKRRLEMQS